jgi:hypothetical protein
MENLRSIIKEVTKICYEELGEGVSADMILDCSTRIFNNPSFNANNIVQDEPEPATEKQIYFLKKAGRQVPSGLTKREASKIIEELKR